MTTRPVRLAALTLVTGALLAAGALPAAAEGLPGPPARPGQPPIGGPALTGTALVMRAKPGATRPLPPPPVQASAWLLADAGTGEVLAAKGPHVRYRPASTLKTLTALTLLPRLDPSAVYTASAKDTRAEGSKVGIVSGATYTVDDLWHGLLLPSANDAASALANANGGWRTTLAQMNAEAQRLQAFDTVAKTPSGLDENGQYISVYDMALIARQVLGMPEFVKVSGTTTYRFPGAMPKAGKKRATYTIYGQNRLLNHGFKGTVAGKTGYTTEGGRTFWVAVERGGRTLIATFLRIGLSTEDTAKALMTWGFAHADQLEPVGTLVEPLSPTPAAVSAGGEVQAVAAIDGQGTTPTTSGPGGLPRWLWFMLPVALVVVVLAGLRQRAVVREQARAEARRSTRRARHWS